MDYVDRYFAETGEILKNLDRGRVRQVIRLLQETKDLGGRLFVIGVGGSAANASHAVNDFRKIAGIESYTPVDNVAELTAWTNDKGFEHIFSEWLKTSRVRRGDCVLVLSVGGGSEGVSKNLILAMRAAKAAGARIAGIVSRDGGETLKLADACVLIPVVSPDTVTPHAEGWQSVLLHLVINSIK